MKIFECGKSSGNAMIRTTTTIATTTTTLPADHIETKVRSINDLLLKLDSNNYFSKSALPSFGKCLVSHLITDEKTS